VSRSVLILTSVRGSVTEDLATAVRSATGVTPVIRSRFDATAWTVLRGRGRLGCVWARLIGMLYPLTVDLGPRDEVPTIIATTNPFWLPAAVAVRRPRAQLVTLVYDVYPESLEVRFRLPAPFRTLLRGVTRFGLRRSAGVVFLGERTRRYLTKRYSLTCPTAVIPPGCAALPARDGPPAILAALAATVEDRTVISYIGNLGSMHDGRTLASALAQVLDAEPGRCAVLVSARGDRADDLIEPLQGRADVTVLGPLEADAWAWVTHRTDIALTSLDADAGLVSLPSKVFASLAGGAAVLAVAPEESDLADLVRTMGVGLVTAPGDVGSAAEALKGLIDLHHADELDRFSRAALEASSLFTPDALAARWRSLLHQVDS
jgi:glycosyltransferase involved in cell wall biosynthesis